MTNSVLTKLPVAKIKLGQTIKIPLSWTEHPFFRSKRTIKSHADIELIKGLGITHVLAYANPDDIIEKQTVAVAQPSAAPIVKAIDEGNALKKQINQSQKRFNSCVTDCRTMLSKIITDPDGAYQLSASIVEQLIEPLFTAKQPILTMIDSNETTLSPVQYCISVAVISVLIAQKLSLDDKQIREIALGGILHDYGKAKIPDSILRKRDELTTSELNFYKLHPVYGVNALKECQFISPTVLHIVGHHHEYLDGSGYPDKLSGKQIPIPTQIVSLAVEFNELLLNDKFSTPQAVLAYLFKNGIGRHGKELLSSLVKVIGVYPPGTLVSLSDGCIAKVITTAIDVKKPNVMAFSADEGASKMRILERENCTINKVINQEALSPASVRSLNAQSPISFCIL
ncbi:MAG: HD-GYP domain-containing protein [Parashewanella sp.]